MFIVLFYHHLCIILQTHPIVSRTNKRQRTTLSGQRINLRSYVKLWRLSDLSRVWLWLVLVPPPRHVCEQFFYQKCRSYEKKIRHEGFRRCISDLVGAIDEVFFDFSRIFLGCRKQTDFVHAIRVSVIYCYYVKNNHGDSIFSPNTYIIHCRISSNFWLLDNYVIFSVWFYVVRFVADY